MRIGCLVSSVFGAALLLFAVIMAADGAFGIVVQILTIAGVVGLIAWFVAKKAKEDKDPSKTGRKLW